MTKVPFSVFSFGAEVFYTNRMSNQKESSQPEKYLKSMVSCEVYRPHLPLESSALKKYPSSVVMKKSHSRIHTMIWVKREARRTKNNDKKSENIIDKQDEAYHNDSLGRSK
jgi:hypothetical protein